MSLPEVRSLQIEDVLEIRPRRFGDERGFFSEVWRDGWVDLDGSPLHFVQDNHSLSRVPGVLRGLHYQLEPAAQHKLVRVTRGAIFDVAVDLRRGSPSFGRWAGARISASEWNQMFVPKGFAHGFVALEPDTEVLYKVSALYSPEHERAVRFDDPSIDIAWPVDHAQLVLSEKDRAAPFLSEAELMG